MELFNATYREPHVVQKFLPEIAEGDKRIVLVDGEVAGAINRVPGEGEIRSNLAVGGTAAKTELTPREEEICAALGPELKRRGLLFVGIDVIGGQWLTEINVTSPTGIVAIDAFNGTDTPALIWAAIDRRLQSVNEPPKYFIHNGYLAVGLPIGFSDNDVAAGFPTGSHAAASCVSFLCFTHGGGRGDKRPKDAPRPPPYRFASMKGSRGQAAPAAPVGPRRAPANAWRSCAAARAG